MCRNIRCDILMWKFLKSKQGLNLCPADLLVVRRNKWISAETIICIYNDDDTDSVQHDVAANSPVRLDLFNL